MSLFKRLNRYWAHFFVDGIRYRKPLKTTDRRKAIQAERALIDAARRGALNQREQGPRKLSQAIERYLAAKKLRCSPRTAELEGERLSLVKKHFGDCPLTSITASRS